MVGASRSMEDTGEESTEGTSNSNYGLTSMAAEMASSEQWTKKKGELQRAASRIKLRFLIP